MVLSRRNAVRYTYTFGVLVTGIFLAERFGGFGDHALWVALVAVAAGWVAYYNRILLSRFDYIAEQEGESAGAND